MSAITGIFYRNGRSIPEEQIKKMNNRLSHRGPDGSAVWCEGSVALGHQMLYTTPESLHEILPFEEDGLVITADARIDNRRELSEKLGIEDKEEVSDSYFILKAYQKWGQRCPEYLLGDFAFAIWDSHQEKLFCARDHMGVKPFYYYFSNDLFLFASEIKAINGSLSSEPEINDLAIAKYLNISFDKEITFYKNILRLPGGHKLSINSSEIEIQEYWKLESKLELGDKSDEEYEKLFYDVFSEAVRCRLRSAFPLGFSLSGGLDSSSVLCTAIKIFDHSKNVPIHTFSNVFDDVPEVDESFYINAVLKDMDCQKHFIKADKINPFSDINKMFLYHDAPNIGANSFLTWNLLSIAQSTGVRTILTGFDGDSVLARFYRYLTELFFNFELKKFHREIKCLSTRFGNDYIHYIKNYVMFQMVPDRLRDIKKRKPMIEKHFASQCDIFNYDNFWDVSWEKRKNLKEYHYFHLTSGLSQKSFENYNHMSAAFSMEFRHPFFDKRMVELCYALPLEQKFKNGWDRIILRRAMENILPKNIQWRKSKSDLSGNFERSILHYGNDTLTRIINDENNLKNYVDNDELKKIYWLFKTQGKEGYRLWIAITLSLWLKYQKELNE